uniref:Uncharacterized protein n=1 Tax=Romanomermis culicivorax TaxID=13658 RepID=A0A915IH93_ROMCU
VIRKLIPDCLCVDHFFQLLYHGFDHQIDTLLSEQSITTLQPLKILLTSDSQVDIRPSMDEPFLAVTVASNWWRNHLCSSPCLLYLFSTTLLNEQAITILQLLENFTKMTLDQNSYVYRTFLCISIVILIATIYVICNVAMKPEVGMVNPYPDLDQEFQHHLQGQGPFCCPEEWIPNWEIFVEPRLSPTLTLASGGIAPASPRKPFNTTLKM